MQHGPVHRGFPDPLQVPGDGVRAVAGSCRLEVVPNFLGTTSATRASSGLAGLLKSLFGNLFRDHGTSVAAVAVKLVSRIVEDVNPERVGTTRQARVDGQERGSSTILTRHAGTWQHIVRQCPVTPGSTGTNDASHSKSLQG